MPWAAFGVSLFVALLLQTTLVPRVLESLDLFLVLALLCSLLTPAGDARIAGWVAGLVQDLAAGGGLGPHAFSLGFCVWVATVLREWIPIRPYGSRLLVSVVAAWLAQLVLWSYVALRFESIGWWSVIGNATSVALWSAILAVLLTALPGLRVRRRPRFDGSRA